jgi:hydrophobic/amphiphilic exporter-1 (mainly G- bacteria), HAE1 family
LKARTRWRVEQAVRRVEAYIDANKERFDVETHYSFWLNDQANTRLYLRPKEAATVPAEEVMERVLADMPEIIIGKPNFTFDNSGTGATSFSIQLSGESTERLAEISKAVAHRLSSSARARGRALRGGRR